MSRDYLRNVEFKGHLLIGRPARRPKSGKYQWYVATMNPTTKTWRVWPSGMPIERVELVSVNRGLGTVLIGVSTSSYE
jgi:hypothetical protein